MSVYICGWNRDIDSALDLPAVRGNPKAYTDKVSGLTINQVEDIFNSFKDELTEKYPDVSDYISNEAPILKDWCLGTIELFRDMEWRDHTFSDEKKDVEQCHVILGATKPKYIDDSEIDVNGTKFKQSQPASRCWLCSGDVYCTNNQKHAWYPQCEHVLPYAAGGLFLKLAGKKGYEKSFGAAAAEVRQLFLKMEYRWSHNICNQFKSQGEFFKIGETQIANPKPGASQGVPAISYIIDTSSIHKFLYGLLVSQIYNNRALAPTVPDPAPATADFPTGDLRLMAKLPETYLASATCEVGLRWWGAWAECYKKLPTQDDILMQVYKAKEEIMTQLGQIQVYFNGALSLSPNIGVYYFTNGFKLYIQSIFTVLVLIKLQQATSTTMCNFIESFFQAVSKCMSGSCSTSGFGKKNNKFGEVTTRQQEVLNAYLFELLKYAHADYMDSSCKIGNITILRKEDVNTFLKVMIETTITRHRDELFQWISSKIIPQFGNIPQLNELLTTDWVLQRLVQLYPELQNLFRSPTGFGKVKHSKKHHYSENQIKLAKKYRIKLDENINLNIKKVLKIHDLAKKLKINLTIVNSKNKRIYKTPSKLVSEIKSKLKK